MPYGNYGGLGMMGMMGGSNRLQVTPSVPAYSPLESAQVGQMVARTAQTETLTKGLQSDQDAQAQLAADAALIKASAIKNTAWKPATSNVVPPQSPSAPIPATGGPMERPQPVLPTSLSNLAQPSNQSPAAASAMVAAPPVQNAGIAVKPGVLPGPPATSYAPLTPPTDHPLLQDPSLQAVTGAHNNLDTSQAVGAHPTFNAAQVYDAVGPNGQNGQFLLNRSGILQDLMGQGRGDLANGLVKQWTDADLQSEKAKQETVVKQHAQLAGMLASFEALPDAMKPQAYQEYLAQAQGEGINFAQMGLPPTYDPKDPQAVAKVKGFAEQARTVAEREKAQLDAVNETMEQQRTAETARHNKADEYLSNQKNLIEAQKAATAAGNLGGPGLMGADYQASLAPDVLNTLKGIATGKLVLPPRGAQTSALLLAANRAFPDVDIPGAAKLTKDLGASNAGTSGGIAEGSNKTLEHIGVMMAQDQAGGQRGSALTPNFIASGANAVTNTLDPAANAAKAAWDQAHAATLTEMSRSFKGGPPGESEVVRDMKTLSFNDPPAKKAAVYKAFSDLLQGQTGAVESQRKAVYGQLDPGTSLLTSKAQGVYKQLHGGSTGDLLPPFDAGGQTPPTLDPVTQGKVDALRAKGVPEAAIQAALAAQKKP